MTTRDDLVDKLVSRNTLTSNRVIQAFRRVPREDFVAAEERDHAYLDTALPIPGGQTISAPHMVAHMTELLDPQPEDKILEIGAGSGYQAAILSQLAGQVITIEIVDELAERAEEKLADYDNVTVIHGDGSTGYTEEAPYDKILYTAAAPKIPDEVFDQLEEGGILIAPVGSNAGQNLKVYTKKDRGIEEETHYGVRFVPLTGEKGNDSS